MSCVMLGGKPYNTEEYYAHCVQQIRAFESEKLLAYKKWLAGTFLECLKTIINRELSQEQFFALYVGIQIETNGSEAIEEVLCSIFIMKSDCCESIRSY